MCGFVVQWKTLGPRLERWVVRAPGSVGRRLVLEKSYFHTFRCRTQALNEYPTIGCKKPCGYVRAVDLNFCASVSSAVNVSERNNTFKKLELETFEDTCSIVAETEDLIVEYCIRKEQIIKLFTVEDKEITPYKRMRKRHIKDWPDDTHRIKEEAGPEVLDSFLIELQLLKHSITLQEDAARHC
ncbi:hypothetical protein ElyMa_003007200 [Elysia marginata]|uniref:Uncharacterized protein n=1 Tax=Elysia marginata TaxID=1093978 RepID=A0AAV4IFE0_9GAST|nr:hypothetical protein ElyMa_003007200 [Elysia marginata]